MEIALLLLLLFLVIYFKSDLNSKLDRIEQKLKRLEQQPETLRKPETVTQKPAPPAQIPMPEIPKPELPKQETQPQAEKVFSGITLPKAVAPEPARKPYVPEKSWWEKFKEQNPDLEKFIGENLINKIGVLILVLGISYLVKFAIDKNWINEPARAGIGILCGALVMGFAHRLRKNYAAFSSVLVAGAVAIFYFTIGIAFHDYQLFSQTVAFIIMVVITAFSALISLSYNRKELAVLSLIGGFAVPFMVRTGEGNYAVLFTYILILDIGILALAYNRKWSIINVLAYVFTVILYGSWLFREMGIEKPHYFGALAFGFGFYFVFILITIINNLRTKGVFSAIELTILASNTFLFYAAGMVILSDFHPEFKGLFTAVLAILNLAYAWLLYKKFGLDKTAVYLLIGLTLTFITLAIPIQFEGNSITLFWAAEAVLLLWLSQKSGIISYCFGSVIVHFLMVVSLLMDWNNLYFGLSILQIVVNPVFVTGTFAVASLVAVWYLLRNENEQLQQFGITFSPAAYRTYAKILAIVLAYFTGIFETVYQSFDAIAEPASAAALPVIYHLLFCAVLCHFLWKSSSLFNFRTASVIAAANIVLFALWFSQYAFWEHKHYIATGVANHTAFYLHYLMLLLVIWFGFMLNRTAKERVATALFRHPIAVWIGAFFTVFIASSELMLHGIIFSDIPVFRNEYLTVAAANGIANVESQIIKSGFPILWGALAFIFLIIGIKKQNKQLRIIALSLLGLTIIKLFLFDIRNASETGKIIAFILLGVLVLIISFVYQKLKVLVLDNPTQTTPTDETE